MAYSTPAAPASAEATVKAMRRYLVTLMPTDSAAMRLSRTAMMARPSRLCMRFSTTATVMSTSTMPRTKVEILSIPTAPLGPLMRIVPCVMPSEDESVMEKCRPASSTPT